MVVSIVQRYRDVGGRGLTPTVGDIIGERYGSGRCCGSIKLQIPPGIDWRDGDVASLGRAYSDDVQYRAVGLFVIAQYIKNLLGSSASSECVILGFDVTGLLGAGFREILMVGGGILVPLGTVMVLRLNLVPLHGDDRSAVIWIPDIALDHIVKHRNPMIGAEHQFRGGVYRFKRLECDMCTIGSTGSDVIASLLAPCRVYAPIHGNRTSRLARAASQVEYRFGGGRKSYYCEPAWR